MSPHRYSPHPSTTFVVTCVDHTPCVVEYRRVGGADSCDVAALVANVTTDDASDWSPAALDTTASGNGQPANLTLHPADDGYAPMAAWVPRLWTFTVPVADLQDGGHTLLARAVDSAGTTGRVVTYGWSVDTQAPRRPNWVSTPDAATASTSATFSWELLGEAGGTCPSLLQWVPVVCVVAAHAAGFACVQAWLLAVRLPTSTL